MSPKDRSTITWITVFAFAMLFLLFYTYRAHADPTYPPEWVRERTMMRELYAQAWAPAPSAHRNSTPIVDPRTQIGVGLAAEDEAMAEWVMAELTLRCHEDAASRWHIARAAQLFNSDVPLYLYLNERTRLLAMDTPPGASEPDAGNRTAALPLLMFAQQLGAPLWTEHHLVVCHDRIADCYPAEEMAGAPKAFATLLTALDGPAPDDHACLERQP